MTTKLTPSEVARAGFDAAKKAVAEYVPSHRDLKPGFLHSYPQHQTKQRDLKTAPSENVAVASPRLTVKQAGEMLRTGQTTVRQLVESCLEAIESRDAELNVFIEVTPVEGLLAQADALDKELREKGPRSPLHGIPISVKGIIDVEGMLATASSKVLDGERANGDAEVVAAVRVAGAVIMGVVHTHEFAMGVITPQSSHPMDPSRDPGGSSGGSAISISTGMALASIGTDTRASIRVPSALQGLVGYKPTFGLSPTTGVITLSWTLDHTAPMTSTVEDAALMLNTMATGTDLPRTAWAAAGTDYASELGSSLVGRKIGVVESALEGASNEVVGAFQHSISKAEAAGAEILTVPEIAKEDFDRSAGMGLLVSRSEAAAYHRWFGAETEQYSPVVGAQLEAATVVSAVEYIQAQRYRQELREKVDRLFETVDCFAMPTCKTTAPLKTEADDYFIVLSENCIPWSFIGTPAVSVPIGNATNGLPVGAQLVCGNYQDARLLGLANAFERSVK